MEYRADIDGLRAVAIIAVVGYHVGLPGFGGGFVGVDVFFVISGYLITRLLWGELREHGTVSWARFYERRIRRLLPALAVVVLATLAVGVAVLVPDPELRWLSQSVVAVAASLSNMFFYFKTSGYFGAEAELQPLLNTWSLAVEEQFYLIWPAVLWLGLRLTTRRGRSGRTAVVALVGGIGAASFLSSILLVRTDQAAAFYWMPPRLWELAAGGVLALVASRRPTMSPRWASAASWVGMGVIVLAVVVQGAVSSFPGLTAVPVVLATALLIAAGADHGANPVARGLGWRPVVAVGLVSYSWYLVHWPMLVYARIVTMESDLLRDTLIGVVSLGVAALSYRYVEQPFRSRRGRFAAPPRAWLLGGVAVLVLIGISGALVLRDTDRWSFVAMSDSTAAAVRENRTAQEPCPDLPTGGAEAVDCRFELGDGPELVLTGDSHALALLPAAKQVATSLGWDLVVLWDTGCPFVTGYRAPAGTEPIPAACVEENRVRQAYLLEHAADIGAVVITSRGTSVVRQSGERDTAAAAAAWQAAMSATLAELGEAGIPTLLVLDVPRFERRVPECVLRRSDCDVSRRAAEEFRAPVADAEMAASSAAPRSAWWDPFPVLCTATTCAAVDDDVVRYRDRDHLSEAGAELVAPELELQLRRQLDPITGDADG